MEEKDLVPILQEFNQQGSPYVLTSEPVQGSYRSYAGINSEQTLYPPGLIKDGKLTAHAEEIGGPTVVNQIDKIISFKPSGKLF